VGRSGHGSVLIDDAKILIFGGYTEQGYTNEVLLINLLDERFETPLVSGNPPNPRENFSMIKINNRVYIFGGFQEGGVLNDMYSIDLMTLTWTPVKTEGPIPPARQGMASTRVGKKIYIVGGCDFHNKICYPDTYILDTDSLWWTKVENE
jgi:N-acetylneuraminic acid mutarotase